MQEENVAIVVTAVIIAVLAVVGLAVWFLFGVGI